MFAVMRRTKKDLPGEQIRPLGVRRKPHQRKIRGGYGVCFWKSLEEDLRAELDLK
jgi:hypothetical protein